MLLIFLKCLFTFDLPYANTANCIPKNIFRSVIESLSVDEVNENSIDVFLLQLIQVL